jgi:HK97 gp10 family phage protein
MIVWNDNECIIKINEVAEKVAEEGADLVLNDAKRILMSKAKHPTGSLASQIEVKKSRFKYGGWIVQAQGPGTWKPPYRATFVELGTWKMDPIPYLRPALKMNKSKIVQLYKDRIK